MKLFLICCICLFIKVDSLTLHFQGTYSYSYKHGKTPYAPSGLLQIHYVNENKILFYLEVMRATDYNSGALYGRLILNKKSGNYEYLPKDTTTGCKLEFIRTKNKVIIKTIGGECGFGYGVYADGAYYLKDSKNPQYLMSRANKKIYFDKTFPENFSED
jgi:hypothetical protein